MDKSGDGRWARGTRKIILFFNYLVRYYNGCKKAHESRLKSRGRLRG
jgi:hypothetical protein